MQLNIDEKLLQDLNFDQIMEGDCSTDNERQSSRFSIVQNVFDFSKRESRISFAFQELEQHLYGTVHISIAESLKTEINKLKEESDITTKQLQMARIEIAELRAENELLSQQAQSQKEIIKAQESFVEVLEKKSSDEIDSSKISNIADCQLQEKYRKIYIQRMAKERESYQIRIKQLQDDFSTFIEEKKIIQLNIFELTKLNERKSVEIHNLNIILYNKISRINEIKKVLSEYYETSVTDEELNEKIKEIIAKIQLITIERAKDSTVLAKIEKIMEKRKLTLNE